MSALPEQACDLLNGFAVMAERNSAFIKDILLGEQRDYSALEKLEQLHLVFWESPLYRFPSPRVRELVRERIPQSEQKAIWKCDRCYGKGGVQRLLGKNCYSLSYLG